MPVWLFRNTGGLPFVSDANTQGATSEARREALVVTSGTPKLWVRRHESGRKMDALFCPECGTRLWHNPHVNDKVSILKPGTLDNARWLEPVGHIWTDSAQH